MAPVCGFGKWGWKRWGPHHGEPRLVVFGAGGNNVNWLTARAMSSPSCQAGDVVSAMHRAMRPSPQRAFTITRRGIFAKRARARTALGPTNSKKAAPTCPLSHRRMTDAQFEGHTAPR